MTGFKKLQRAASKGKTYERHYACLVCQWPRTLVMIESKTLPQVFTEKCPRCGVERMFASVEKTS